MAINYTGVVVTDISGNTANVNASGELSTRSCIGTLMDRSGTATNVSTEVMTTNSSRKYLFIQNLGNIKIYFNFTSDATAGSGSIELSPFSAFIMEGSFVSTESINIIRGGGSDTAFTAKEG